MPLLPALACGREIQIRVPTQAKQLAWVFRCVVDSRSGVNLDRTQRDLPSGPVQTVCCANIAFHFESQPKPSSWLGFLGA